MIHGISLGGPLPLTVTTVNLVATLKVGPVDFIVLYNKYWDPLYDGMPGCTPTGTEIGCSTSFAMRVSILPDAA